ncbi:MAG: hypothetical protein WD712_01035 [Candidatus Spechtbacterales bacterium]
MIIVLHGEDSFRSRHKLAELKTAYQKKYAGGFLFKKFDAAETTFKDFKNTTRSQSLFDDRKLVVLEDLSQNPGLKKEVVEWEELKAISADANLLVIFYEPQSVAKDKQYKIVIKKAFKEYEFKKLPPAGQVEWFVSNIYPREEINKEIVREVVGLSGGDMWQIHNELNKLFTYGNGKDVKKSYLQVLGVGAGEAQIFSTIDAIFGGNKDKALRNMLVHWYRGEAPEYLFFMIERQLKLLALVNAEGEISKSSLAKTLGLHPFVVQKTLRLSGGFSWPKIKNLYERVESLDIKSKRGELDPYLSCELLAVAILS